MRSFFGQRELQYVTQSLYAAAHAVPQTLRRVQYRTVKLGGAVKIGITTLTEEQMSLLASLQVEKPRAAEQMTLL